jgi:C4-dicarboxylate-specific signal transduction histidine kinase
MVCETDDSGKTDLIERIAKIESAIRKFARDKRNNCVKNNAIQNTYYKSTHEAQSDKQVGLGHYR